MKIRASAETTRVVDFPRDTHIQVDDNTRPRFRFRAWTFAERQRINDELADSRIIAGRSFYTHASFVVRCTLLEAWDIEIERETIGDDGEKAFTTEPFVVERDDAGIVLEECIALLPHVILTWLYHTAVSFNTPTVEQAKKSEQPHISTPAKQKPSADHAGSAEGKGSESCGVATPTPSKKCSESNAQDAAEQEPSEPTPAPSSSATEDSSEKQGSLADA